MPLQFLRGRIAGTLGLPSDVANLVRSPMPMEMYGDVDYGPQTQVPYGSQELLRTLPLPPQGAAQQAAANVGAVVPLTPMEALQAARAARQAAFATGRTLGPTAARMTEGYLQRQGLMPGVVPAEAPKFNANQLAQSVKPRAEVSPLGFYSAVEQQALNLPRKQGTGESFLNDLAKGQDVKKYEMETMGLDAFLRGRTNVTRQEVQDFIANNRINVQERQLGTNPTRWEGNALYVDGQVAGEIRDTSSGYAWRTPDGQYQMLDANRMFDAVEKVQKNLGVNVPESAPTKYGKYQLPGGDNYREILLTLPKTDDAVKAHSLAQSQALSNREKAGELLNKPGYMPTAKDYEAYNLAEAKWNKLRDTPAPQSNQYRSSHFNEPNILAHMRVNDRVDADGKKMLLIEEVQSDWHQAGREKGYNTPEKRAAEQKKFDDLLIERQQLGERQKQLEELASPYTSQGKDAPRDILDEWNSVSNRLNRLQTEQNRLGRSTGEGVPDAPFKETWHQLALKRALKEAVDKGYDRIGLTTGKQQIDRFSDQLRQNVDEINFNPIGTQNEISVNAKKNGQNTFSGTIKDGKFIDGSAVGKTVEEVLGKTMAKQIAEKKDGVIKGDDLTIGGEGMKKYYDEIYPAFLEKQGKKYGAKVGETKLSGTGSKDELAQKVYGVGETYKNLPSEQKRKIDQMFMEKGAPVRYLDITPEMRKAIKEGQPIASITNHLANAMA
jgi:hypothetical protein